MLREIIEPLALFAAPFLFYAISMLLLADIVPKDSAWSRGHVSGLALVGLVLALVGVLVFGFSAPRSFGNYVPAHIDNGKLIAGHMD